MKFFLFGILILIIGGILVVLYLREIFKEKKLFTTVELKMKRLKICTTCKHVKLSNTIYIRCNECGCFLHPKAKLKNQKCPIDKWPE